MPILSYFIRNNIPLKNLLLLLNILILIHNFILNYCNFFAIYIYIKLPDIYIISAFYSFFNIICNYITIYLGSIKYFIV